MTNPFDDDNGRFYVLVNRLFKVERAMPGQRTGVSVT